MSQVIASITVELVRTSCAECGIHFGVPDWYDKTRRERGGSFHCPNGHSLHYGDTENDRLRKELDSQRRAREFAEKSLIRANEKNSMLETEAKRLKRRTSNGVCTECNRSFANVQKHMLTKHPKSVA